MNMNQKRKKCAEKNSSNNQNNIVSKSVINWFPGHMKRTYDNLKEELKIVDVVIEIKDARMPFSSSNPYLEELIINKPRLILYNKKDCCDIIKTNNLLQDIEIPYLIIDSLNEKIKDKIISKVKEILKEKIERYKSKGIRKKMLRAMVVGIPNVGKSTVINKLVGKNVAKTENRPGVTKKVNWIKIHQDLELLDSPGVLWPKFVDQEVGIKLALLGSINDEVVDKEEICSYAINYLYNNYNEVLTNRYGSINIDNYIESIAKNMNWLVSDGQIDKSKTLDQILKDIRNNIIKHITWD